jgi:NAD(P)-dependent dehydrogenase (short-subunit alcohol dehydrogenase family)
MTAKTWFITGTSRGLGREWATAALERGDRVAATARDITALRPLVEAHGDSILPLTLDVNDRAAAFAAIDRAHGHFGRLDVIVNNAAYAQYGMVEEVSETETRAQMETNFFGALWVTQACLPHLRRQRAGHIVQVSSISGITAFPSIGIYAASKWALEGFSQALAQEVRSFGIKVTLIEPGGYATDGPLSAASNAQPFPAYESVRADWGATREALFSALGDPTATRDAVLRVVDTDEPPLRVFFGKDPLDFAVKDYESRLRTWREWNALSIAAYGAAKQTK